MKITRIRTLAVAEAPKLLFVLLDTDEGLTGLGETVFMPDAVATIIHNHVAPMLLGKDPRNIERHWNDLFESTRTMLTRGAEMRALSAVDIALWDLFGKAVSMPVHQAMGGTYRDSIPVYNTCAGYRYGPYVAESRSLGNYQPSGAGTYEDLEAFLNRPAELAQDLFDEGFRAMKIWPLDRLARPSAGHKISLEELKEGLGPLEEIRKALGDKMEIMLEMHNLWDVSSAIRIARAAEALEPAWYEDPVRMDNIRALKQFHDATGIATCASETLSTRWSFRELFQAEAVSVAMADLAWCGGLSEGRKIAAMADAFHLPVTFHDCTGPVTFMASVHLCMHAPNAQIQEMVRAFYTGWFPKFVTQLPEVKDGSVYAPSGPGLGTELRPETLAREDVTLRASSL